MTPITPGFRLLQGGTELPVVGLELSNAINTGWSWSASVAGPVNPDLPDETEYRIFLEDDLNAIESPPLMALQRSNSLTVSGGESGQLSGIDRTTWRLSKDDLSLDTFLDTQSGSIAAALAAAAGVSISGLPAWDVAEEDVQNNKVLDALTRLLAVAGQNWHVDLAGVVRCTQVSALGPPAELPLASIRYTADPSQRVDQLTIEKTSRIAGGASGGDGDFCFDFDSVGFKTVQFPNPIVRPIAFDRSSYGYAESVAIFAGDPQGGDLIDFFWFGIGDPPNLTAPFTGAGQPATSATVTVKPPTVFDPSRKLRVRVCFAGSPPPPPNPGWQQDASFRITVGSGARPASGPWVENLIPTQAWATAHGSDYLRERNKGFKKLDGEGPLSLAVDLGQTFTHPGFPTGKIESYTHSISLQGVTTRVSGYVPYP